MSSMYSENDYIIGSNLDLVKIPKNRNGFFFQTEPGQYFTKKPEKSPTEQSVRSFDTSSTEREFRTFRQDIIGFDETWYPVSQNSKGCYEQQKDISQQLHKKKYFSILRSHHSENQLVQEQPQLKKSLSDRFSKLEYGEQIIKKIRKKVSSANGKNEPTFIFNLTPKADISRKLKRIRKLIQKGWKRYRYRIKSSLSSNDVQELLPLTGEESFSCSMCSQDEREIQETANYDIEKISTRKSSKKFKSNISRSANIKMNSYREDMDEISTSSTIPSTSCDSSAAQSKIFKLSNWKYNSTEDEGGRSSTGCMYTIFFDSQLPKEFI